MGYFDAPPQQNEVSTFAKASTNVATKNVVCSDPSKNRQDQEDDHTVAENN